jgi:hypothetical protein
VLLVESQPRTHLRMLGKLVYPLGEEVPAQGPILRAKGEALQIGPKGALPVAAEDLQVGWGGVGGGEGWGEGFLRQGLEAA